MIELIISLVKIVYMAKSGTLVLYIKLIMGPVIYLKWSNNFI